MMSTTLVETAQPAPATKRKIVILGQEKAGKTAVFNRLIHRRFSTTATLSKNGFSIGSKKIGNDDCELIDSPNEKESYEETKKQMLGADAFIYVFDSRKYKEDITRDLEILRDTLLRAPGAHYHLVFCEIALSKTEEILNKAFQEKIDGEVSLLLRRDVKSVTCSPRFPKGYDEIERNIADGFAKPAYTSPVRKGTPRVSPSLFGSKNALNGYAPLAAENKEDALVEEIKLLKAKLEAERDSWWPYPNKDRKDAKAQFWQQILDMYGTGEAVSLSNAVVAALTQADGKVGKGYFSHRTADLIEKIQREPGLTFKATI